VVRVDMLERLADLIRDRVFWRPRIPEEQRPAGSVEGGGFTIVSDMMSLVGCSGEEFQGILRSLGFRMQKKKVKAPAAVPPPPPAEESEAPAAEDTVVAIEDIAAPMEVVAETLPAPEAPLEDIEIEVWWPKDTGPFRHKHEHKTEKPKHHRKEAHKPDGRTGKPERPQRPPKPEKPIDPDSPFAVLGALKAKMAGGKN
jgi:ATP-dependent RNA helicase SUPV3L1/SUV3